MYVVRGKNGNPVPDSLFKTRNLDPGGFAGKVQESPTHASPA